MHVSSGLPGVTVVGLPDASEIRDAAYRSRLHPDYVARPSIGYAPDSYGRNLFGGTTAAAGFLTPEGAAAFGNVGGIGVDGLDRVWVADGQNQELRVFDAQ